MIIVKKVVLGFAAFLVSATLMEAALLLNDSFSYPDGPLVTAAGSPWTTYSGSVPGQVKVVSGRMFLSKANTEDVHALLAGQPYAATPGTILYVSFKINYTNLPSSAGSYFAEFKDGGTGFRARIFAPGRGRGDRHLPHRHRQRRHFSLRRFQRRSGDQHRLHRGGAPGGGQCREHLVDRSRGGNRSGRDGDRCGTRR